MCLFLTTRALQPRLKGLVIVVQLTNLYGGVCEWSITTPHRVSGRAVETSTSMEAFDGLDLRGGAGCRTSLKCWIQSPTGHLVPAAMLRRLVEYISCSLVLNLQDVHYRWSSEYELC